MKQRFSSLDVKVIARELSHALVSLRVANIYDLSSRIFLFKFAKPGCREQLLVESGFRCHLTNFRRTTAAEPSAFVSRLRKCLKSRRVTSISQVGTDRVIELEFSEGQYRLFLEFFAAGNIVLTDKEYNILALLRCVSEGDENVDVKVGVRYPIAAKQHYAGVPPVTEERLRRTLEGQVLRAEAPAGVTDKKSKKKGGVDLKKTLNTGFPEYPTHLLDHAFMQTSFDATIQPAQALEDVHLLSQLMKAVELSDRVFQSLSHNEQPKGYIIAKAKQGDSKENIAAHGEGTSLTSRENLLYDDFHPFKPSQFEGKSGVFVLEFDGFSKTVDEFYSSTESQKLESRLTEKEENAKRKIERAREEHEKRLGALQKVQELHIRKAEAIEANAHRVEEAIAAVNGLIGQGMDWMDIAKLIENEQSRQNVVAETIKLPLKLYENTVTLLLEEASFEDEGDAGGYETDEVGESNDEKEEEEEEEEARTMKNTSAGKKLAIDVDLGLSPWANARQYYDQKRTAAQKEQKTLQASSKALKSTEQKISADLKKGLKQEKDVLRPTRKQFWFEKFWYFLSSDGYLVLGGKDVQQNELLYRRYLKKGDVYVHADLPGAASVVVKNAISTPDAPIPPSTLSQAGSFSVCTSTAWDSKAVMAAWWVKAEQVSKTAPTGEYLTTGGFMIKGEKNFLPPAQLLLGFAVAFQISDESKARHLKHRVHGKDAAEQEMRSQVMDNEVATLSLKEGADSLGEQQQQELVNQDQSEAVESKMESESGSESEVENWQALERDEDESVEGVSDPESEDRTGATNPLQNGDGFGRIDGSVEDESENPHSDDEESEEGQQAVEDIEEPFNNTSSSSQPITAHGPTKQKPQQSQQQPPPKQRPLPRGKRTKAAKRTLAKYAQQDEQERALAMQILGSAKAEAKKKAAAVDKATRDAKAAADKERRRAQHERAAAAERKRMEWLAKVEERGAAADNNREEEDDDDEEGRARGMKELVEQEKRELANINALVGTPLPGDEILAALPVVAPWTALATYKYKTKLQPGSVKKGKAVREMVARWVEGGTSKGRGGGGASINGTLGEGGGVTGVAEVDAQVDVDVEDKNKVRAREIECIKAWRVEEVIGVLPVGRVRIVFGGPGSGGGTGGGEGAKGKGKSKAGAGGGGGGRKREGRKR